MTAGRPQTPYPANPTVQDRLRRFFGIPNAEVQVDLFGALIAADLSPEPFYLPWRAQRHGAAAMYPAVGLGVVGDEHGGDGVEISDVWVKSDTAGQVLFSTINEFTGWTTFALLASRTHQQGYVSGVYTGYQDYAAAPSGEKVQFRFNPDAATWQKVPGIFQVDNNAVFLARNSDVATTIEIMALARALET